MTHRETIPILFSGGSYGTYLEYLLNTWTDQGSNLDQSTLPFTDQGSAHGYVGQHLINLQGWQQYLSQSKFYKFVRLHPKTLKSENINNNIAEIADSVKHLILITVDPNSELTVLNNYYSKVWTNWIQTQFADFIDPDAIYQHWPVELGTNINEIPKWILREFFSYYLMPAWQDQTRVDQHNLPNNVINVTVNNLLQNFQPTFDQILSQCELVCNTNLDHIHNAMLQGQKFLHNQQHCEDIVNAVKNHSNCEYRSTQLTFVDEVWIQWQLRNLGIELACHDMNQFPRSLSELMACSKVL